MTERQMVDVVRERLARRGTSCVAAVPFMSRCIDLVIMGGNGVVTAVEFKLRDWRRGIQQARDHLLGVDYSCVCLPHRAPSRELVCACTASGIGLLLFDPESDDPYVEAVSPCCSQEIWSPGREWLLAAMTAALETAGETCATAG
jgi:hypothetical protein